MDAQVDRYLAEGCGRCKYGGTPECKVHLWTKPLVALRSIALEAGLTEELKWGMPCYTHEGRNIAMVVAFKEHAAFSFFKGSLLDDPDQILVAPGENSSANRQARFTNLKEIAACKTRLLAWVRAAIELERSGAKVQAKKDTDFDLPEELVRALEASAPLRKAWEGLTPGRRKAYLLHFSQAKQSATRQARIERCAPSILAGKGLDDR